MEIFRHSESPLQLEDDLYFEMEFEPGKENRMLEEADQAHSSSKSVSSSLSSETTGSGSLRDDRRGSSVGPILERPKYLRICSNPERKLLYKIFKEITQLGAMDYVIY